MRRNEANENITLPNIIILLLKKTLIQASFIKVSIAHKMINDIFSMKENS